MQTLCIEIAEPFMPGRDGFGYGCALPRGGGPYRGFSRRGDHACYLNQAVPADGGALALGWTLAESDCDALHRDLGRDCYWTDGSVRTRTPPLVHTTCPAAPSPSPVLCGGPCGNCDYVIVGDISELDVACVGRNDDRDLGVCALPLDMTEGCSPDTPASRWCPEPIFLNMEWPTDTCSCLSFRRAEGFERAGWVVPTSNCATYRALYPGEVECYDDTWTPLP